MSNICLSGHIFCDSQKPIIFLRYNFKCLFRISFNSVINFTWLRFSFFGRCLRGPQQLNQLNNNIRINFTLLIINTLFLANKINTGKHNQSNRIGNLINTPTIEELLRRLNNFFFNTFFFPLQIHSKIRKSSK